LRPRSRRVALPFLCPQAGHTCRGSDTYGLPKLSPVRWPPGLKQRRAPSECHNASRVSDTPLLIRPRSKSTTCSRKAIAIAITRCNHQPSTFKLSTTEVDAEPWSAFRRKGMLCHRAEDYPPESPALSCCIGRFDAMLTSASDTSAFVFPASVSLTSHEAGFRSPHTSPARLAAD
jgi:hypothetical protein